jgi:hypothetical protein
VHLRRSSTDRHRHGTPARGDRDWRARAQDGDTFRRSSPASCQSTWALALRPRWAWATRTAPLRAEIGQAERVDSLGTGAAVTRMIVSRLASRRSRSGSGRGLRGRERGPAATVGMVSLLAWAAARRHADRRRRRSPLNGACVRATRPLINPCSPRARWPREPLRGGARCLGVLIVPSRSWPVSTGRIARSATSESSSPVSAPPPARIRGRCVSPKIAPRISLWASSVGRTQSAPRGVDQLEQRADQQRVRPGTSRALGGDLIVHAALGRSTDHRAHPLHEATCMPGSGRGHLGHGVVGNNEQGRPRRAASRRSGARSTSGDHWRHHAAFSSRHRSRERTTASGSTAASPVRSTSAA